MQAFTQKTLSQAVLVGALLAASIAAALVFRAQLKQVQADELKLTQAEADYTRLQTDMARWKKALASVRAGVTLRQEPLNITVALPPEQLYELPPILSKVFDPEGYFSLKQFKFEWKTEGKNALAGAGPAMPGVSQAGVGGMPAPKLAHVSLQGDRTLILKTEKTTP